MAGLNTAKNIIQTERKVTFLSHATTITTSDISATATPNPDYTGNTGYASVGSSRGLNVTSDTFFISPSFSGTYPNYTIGAFLKPEYMGSYSGFLIPRIKDFSGLEGDTSGKISVSYSRSFTWTDVTSYNRNVTNGTDNVAWFIRSSATGVAFMSSDVISNPNISAGNWNTLPTPSDIASYNEVMFEDLSGSTDWVVGTYTGSTTTYGKAKATFYTIPIAPSGLLLKINPRATVGTTSCGVRITFRNKTNTAITFVQDVTLSLTRV